VTPSRGRRASKLAKRSVPEKKPAKPAERNERLALLLLTLAGAGLRLALWKTQSIPSVDGIAYLRIARSFTGEPPLDSVHQYGYPALIALVHAMGVEWTTAARVLAFVSGVALIPLTWALAGRFVSNRRLRLFPAVAIALLPLPVRYALTTMTEAPYLALLLAAFVLALRGRGLLAGMAGGAAYAVRPEALLAVLLLGLLRLRAAPRTAVRLALGTLLVVVPYVTAVGLATGTWSLSRKANLSATSWEEAEERAGETAVSKTDLAERWRAYRADTARQYPARALQTLTQLLRQAGWTSVPAAAAALSTATLPLAAGLALLPFLALNFLAGNPRFVHPFLPFVWILAAVCVTRMRGRTARGIVIGGLAAGLIASAVLERRLYTLNEDGSFPELVRAGTWLHRFAGPGTLVYDRKPYTAYYAGARGRWLPTGSRDAVLGQIVADGGDYLVVNDWVMRHYRPELLPLATDATVIGSESRLAPVYFEQSKRGLRTIIYRVVRPGGLPPIPGEAGMRERLLLQLKDTKTAG
jgi:hypothetical protein